MIRALALLSLIGCADHEVAPTTACVEDLSYAAHTRSAEYQELLEAFFADNQMPGAIVGIQRGDEPPWVGATGVANLARASPMQTCTPFRAGSITKMAVGVRVMQLVDAGDLDLDAPVTDALPDLVGEIDGVEGVTVRMLLDHSSGLRQPSEEDLSYQLSILDDPEAAAERPYLDKLADEVYGRGLLFEPGTDSHYSNAGYWLLGRVLEAVDGRPFADVLRDELFAPYGLDSMRVSDHDDPALARGYSPMDGMVADVTAWDRADSDGDPAGGLAAHAADLLAFARLLFDGDLVSAESLAEMQNTTKFPTCPGGDCEYGLGIESISSYPSIGYGKNGSLPGVDANVFHHPDEDLTLVVFANWGAGNRKEMFEALFQATSR